MAPVRAEERRGAMLPGRSERAVEEALGPDFIAALYKLVVAHFIGREKEKRAGKGWAVAVEGAKV